MHLMILCECNSAICLPFSSAINLKISSLVHRAFPSQISQWFPSRFSCVIPWRIHPTISSKNTQGIWKKKSYSSIYNSIDFRNNSRDTLWNCFEIPLIFVPNCFYIATTNLSKNILTNSSQISSRSFPTGSTKNFSKKLSIHPGFL